MINLLDIFHKLIQVIPYLGVVSPLCVGAVLLVLGHSSIFQYAAIFLLPISFISLLYIIKKSDICVNISNYIESMMTFSINKNIKSRYSKIYLILFILTIFWLLITNTRDVVFLILIILMYCVTILQIFLDCNRKVSVVIQAMLTTLLLVLSKNLMYYYSYAIEDPIPHSMSISNIISTGTIDLISGDYVSYPLLHITGAITSLLTNCNSFFSLYVIGAVAVVMGAIFVYYISYYISNSWIISSISGFCYLLLPIIGKYAWSVTARSLEPLMFLIILYLFFKVDSWQKKEILICSSVVCLYMAMIHHAQIVPYYIIMAIFCISYLTYYGIFSKKQLIVLLCFYLIPFGYFVYHYLNSILWIFHTYFEKAESVLVENIVSIYTSADISLYYLSYILPSIFLVILSVFGMYYLISISMIKPYQKIVTMLPISLLFILFVDPIYKLIPIGDLASIVMRFQITLTPFFAIIIAIGCITLCYMTSIYLKFKYVGVGTVCLVLVLFVIASPICQLCKDDTLFSGSELSEKTYFTYDEIVLFNYVSDNFSDNTNIYTDLYSRLLLRYTYHGNVTSLSSLTLSPPPLNQGESTIIFREAEFKTRGLVVTNKDYSDATITGGHIYFSPDNNKIFESIKCNSNVIYNNYLSKIMVMR